MTGKENTTQIKKEMAKKMWLLYFNDVLWKKTVITEQEKNRMIQLIEKKFGNIGR